MDKWRKLVSTSFYLIFYKPLNDKDDVFDVVKIVRNTNENESYYGTLFDYVIENSVDNHNSIEQTICNIVSEPEYKELGHKYLAKDINEMDEMFRIREIDYNMKEHEQYFYLAFKNLKISDLTEQLQEIDDELDDNAEEEFVTEFHCSYEFNDDGVSLINSDTEDMEWTIDHFVQSECKNWKGFGVYLADKKIEIYEKHLRDAKEE